MSRLRLLALIGLVATAAVVLAVPAESSSPRVALTRALDVSPEVCARLPVRAVGRGAFGYRAPWRAGLQSRRPLCGGGFQGCRTTSTSGGSGSMTMSTSIYWCWTGYSVGYVDPPGGTTHASAGGWFYWSWWEWDHFTRWSYCCVGQYTYNIYKTGRWVCTYSCGSATYACVHNALHLHGNGSYAVRPSAVENC
jgi:hypothetical protein